MNSFGIHASEIRYGVIRNILIIFRIFCGWMIRSKLSRLGIFEKKNVFSVLAFYNIYSGDGTLSVMDVRANKAVAVAQSEDQEDELLSVVAIKSFVFIPLIDVDGFLIFL